MTEHIPPTNVTFTGASDDTNIEYMFEMSERFPFIEWGILYSHKRSGSDPRYPSRDWIDTFLDKVYLRSQYNKHINYAIHVCGKAVVDLKTLDRSVDFLHFKTNKQLMRLQLNFSLDKIAMSRDELNRLIASFHPAPVITQHNDINAEIAEWELPPNHQILFDQSGGRGIAPTQWLPPIPEKVTGYAGSLGPHNIGTAGVEIMKIAAPPYWIDMETHIRSDDRLDPDKCLQVAQVVDAWTTLIEEF